MGWSVKQKQPDIAIIIFSAMALLPLLFLIFYALTSVGAKTYVQITGSLPLLLRSVGFAILVALFSTLAGTLAALSVYGRTGLLAAAAKVFILLPLFITPYSFAVSWDKIFFALHLTPALKTFLILAMVFTPVAYIIVFTSLRKLPQELLEAAIIHTSNKNKIIRRIVIPYLKPSLVSAFTLVFIFAISEFTVPVYYGVNLYAAKIFTEFSAFYDYNLAIIHSAVLLVVILVILWAELKTFGEVPLISTSASTESKYQLLPAVFLFVIFFYVAVVVLMPVVNISISTDMTELKQAVSLLSVPIINSIIIALATSFFIVALTVTTATINYVKQKRFNAGSIYIFPFAVPSIILGIAFIYFYNTPALNFIYSSVAIIIFGLTAKFSYLSYKIVFNQTKTIDFSEVEVAKIHRFNTVGIILKIVLPQIRNGIIAAFFIVFVFSYLEAGLSVMVYPPGMQLAVVKVFTLTANSPEKLSYALNLVLILSGLLFAFVLYGVVRIFNKKGN